MGTLEPKLKETVFIQTEDGEAVVRTYPWKFRFAAISYHWAPDLPEWELETPQHTAIVGAFYRKHFKRLLKWVEEKFGHKGIHHVWIDAISINQRNETIKAKQLPEITFLFHSAAFVIAAPWLAYKTGEISEVQMYHNYMQRCWVIAEITSGKRVCYTTWDGKKMHYDFNSTEPDSEGFCPPGTEEDDMSDEQKEKKLDMSNRVVILRENRKFGSLHIDEVIKIALDLKATEEKDKLYALMPTAGLRVPRLHGEQMDLQSCVLHFMRELGTIDRLRLVMGVSRFRKQARISSSSGGSAVPPSWSFGEGAEYWTPWANNEYLANRLNASVALNEGSQHSITFRGSLHQCKLTRGPESLNSEYYGGIYSPRMKGDPEYIFYYPQLDRNENDVTLCRFGLDFRNRAVGVIVETGSHEKIGTFMMEADLRHLEQWRNGQFVIY